MSNSLRYKTNKQAKIYFTAEISCRLMSSLWETSPDFFKKLDLKVIKFVTVRKTQLKDKQRAISSFSKL